MITVENHKGAIAISVQGKEIDVACEFATLLSYLDEHPKIKNLANLIAKNAYMCGKDCGSKEEAIKKAEDYAKKGKIPNNKLNNEELEKAIEQEAKKLVDGLRKLIEDELSHEDNQKHN
ncbi:MAG: hypothetical protein MR283_00120 [Erysipelotrichaceae bacterium]|nr:hypothetical protein [Erysipelotrichaceae bacterium]MDY6035704.1 hypothetical protein [Bulleidia sp.]